MFYHFGFNRKTDVWVIVMKTDGSSNTSQVLLWKWVRTRCNREWDSCILTCGSYSRTPINTCVNQPPAVLRADARERHGTSSCHIGNATSFGIRPHSEIGDDVRSAQYRQHSEWWGVHRRCSVNTCVVTCNVSGRSFEENPYLRGLTLYYSKHFEMTPTPFPECPRNHVYKFELLCVQIYRAEMCVCVCVCEKV